MSVVRNVLLLNIRKSIKPFATPNITRRVSSDSSNIISSGLTDVEIPGVSVPEYIFSKCSKFDSFTALECGITGRKYTYSELIKKSRNFGRSLRKRLKLREGDVIAVLLPNIPEFPIAVLGALHAGLIVTTLNHLYTKDEIARQLRDSSAKAFVTLSQLVDTANASCNLIKNPLPIINIKTERTQPLPGGAIDFGEFTDNTVDHPEPPPRSSDDVAFLPYSSGTTGLPKGVQLTNFNLVANISQNLSEEMPFIEETTNSHQDIIPVVLPMFHIYGFSVNTLLTLSKGTKLVTLPKFTPEDYVAILQKQKPHILCLVPPIILFLTGHPMVKPEDLHSVRVTFSGAAPLGALDEERFLEKAGKGIHMLQGYGLTETSPTISSVSIKLKDQLNVCGSVGRPIPNTFVKIVKPDDPTATPLGPNCNGELLVKGPQVMKGYLNKPEETATTFVDGWLRTGDMAFYNEDRLIFITDRLKELIKVKGFQVAPAELEEIIRDFPNVDDAAVIGVPHSINGEAPRAYVVPKRGAKINVAELEAYVKSKVAHYKRLNGGVAIVESIPKNASGKIMRRVLKLDYEKTQRK